MLQTYTEVSGGTHSALYHSRAGTGSTACSTLSQYCHPSAFLCKSWQKHLVIVLIILWHRPTLQSVGWDYSKAAWGLIRLYRSGMAVNSREHAECNTLGERNFMKISGVSNDHTIHDRLLQGEFSLLQETQTWFTNSQFILDQPLLHTRNKHTDFPSLYTILL